tara:strand:- start:2834 stop:3682 length:849 start_codon:yes stop_codon:yes gene_type:complete
MKILTFDIEEWFHILDNQTTKTEKNWNLYEKRIDQNMDKIFRFLELNNLKATFFVVGWIAEKYPHIVKKIDSLNFEIGSHTHYHQLMYEQSRKEVSYDLEKSIYTLENITGKKVRCFRAPGFSITEKNKWAFEVLIDKGITHDCSVFPASRAHGGIPSYRLAIPSKLKYNGLELKEFPINTTKFFTKNWIFSGGGYFRLTPYNLIKYWTSKSEYVMTYFHPRDFDPSQPVIKELSYYRKFKSYVGLNNSLIKLNKWVNDFEFIDIKKADDMINWDKVPIVNI